jgi:hypothetical protein
MLGVGVVLGVRRDGDVPVVDRDEFHAEAALLEGAAGTLRRSASAAKQVTYQ